MHHAFFIKHGCYRSPFGAILAILAILRQLRRKCCQDSETNRIIKNQHETQMSHSIKLRTSAKTKFTSPLPLQYFISVPNDHTSTPRKSKLKESKNSKKPRGSLVPFQYGSVVNNLRLPFVPKCFPALSTYILTQKEIFGQDVKVQLFIVAPKSKVFFEMSVTKRA